MKYLSYKRDGLESIGLWVNDLIFDIPQAARFKGIRKMPGTLLEFLDQFDNNHQTITSIFAEVNPAKNPELFFPAGQATILPPLPHPGSLRDFYAFENHVKTARKNRGLDMIPEWYDFPVFYFSNHQAVYGPENVIPYPLESNALDYELEVAAIIGKRGRNIPENDADTYIAGYTIMNDWSARDIQREEMKVGLGPAKGKDFATSLGPWLVSRDELASHRTKSLYNLPMTAIVNGKKYSSGNWNTLYYSFAQMIARASENCTLYPGDVIGSGTVGTGCILELGSEKYGWLQPGDEVILEIEGLGRLRNTIGPE